MAFLLPHLLRESAASYPDYIAVSFKDQQLTYRELDQQTDRLAAALIEAGVQRQDRIGIFMNKSHLSIVSLLGILKADAVYVPIDPNSPLPRTRYIIENCGIKVVLTSENKISKIKDLLQEGVELKRIFLMDGDPQETAQLPANTTRWERIASLSDLPIPELQNIETDLAYILYTSGSTGVPKGVMISHINSLTFVNWAFRTFQVMPTDRLSNHAPLHFDLSILDVFVALKAGASVVLVPEGLSTFPFRLVDWIVNNRITIWYSVPSILSRMVLHGRMERHSFPDLRTILFAGEVFPVKFLRQLMHLVPAADYYNLYGPTETNVITFYKVPPLAPERSEPIPIGKACENMEVFALDPQGNKLTAPGERGELYARGSCVAMGYWGDPQKTARHFVANPLNSRYPEIAYRTGDLVSLDAEGNYLYLGRVDHMVKSKGYRIELGEIETILYSHPEIKEAAVIPIPDEVIGNRLKAFVVSASENGLDANDLKKYCFERIPDYMVPDEIEFRAELPKTSTGKIDRPALSVKS